MGTQTIIIMIVEYHNKYNNILLQKMTVHIASFDVGIKNMAYCIFAVDETVSILEWKILDLTQTEEQVTLCNVHTKGKPCKHTVEYVKNNVFVCKKHAMASKEYKIQPNQKKLSSLSVQKMKEIILDIQKEETSEKQKSKEDWIHKVEELYKKYYPKELKL